MIKYKLEPLGCNSPSDPRDYTFDMLSMSTNNVLPDKYSLDWSPYDILDQGAIGSCKAHALSMIKTYIDGVSFNNRYSVGWIYGNRYDDDWQGSGLISRETIKHLVNEGSCEHSIFPINEEYPNIKQTMKKYGLDKLLKNANKHKSLAYVRLSRDDIKSYLYNYKKPILIDVYVYDNFYDADKNNGVIPKYAIGNKRGGHSMIIIGYIGDLLIIINSWSSNKGDHGIYYLDLNSSIIKELWCLEDILNVNRPVRVNYGWEKIEEVYPGGIRTKWKYLKIDGQYAKEEWVKVNNDWFYIGADTIMYENRWVLYKTDWYFLGLNGYMKTSSWIDWRSHDGYWYYVDADGKMLKDCITPDGYKVDSQGRWI